MANYVSALDFHLHFVGGDEQHYSIEETDQAERVLKEIQPNRLFLQKAVTIAGTYFMAGFSADQLTRIELVTKIDPGWRLPGGIKELVEISPEQFDRKALPRRSDPARSELLQDPGTDVETLAEIRLSDGHRICVRMTATAQGAVDQRSQLMQLFGGTGFHVIRRGRGVVILNSKQISHWTLLPGPAKAPTNAWRAHRLDPKRRNEDPPSALINRFDLDELHKDLDDVPSKTAIPLEDIDDSAPPLPPKSQSNEMGMIPETMPMEEIIDDTPDSRDLRETGEISKPHKRRILKFGKKD